jgi:mannosyltransferase OCH1-like enzyme
MGNEILMVLVLLILVGYGMAFRKKKTYNQAPRKIWTYWEEPDHLDPYKCLSDRAKECMRSWGKLNPDYEIIMLTKKTYQGYTTIPEGIQTHPDLNPDHVKDMIQLWTLVEHGGVWLDPTIYLTQPLDDWMFPKYAECSMFKQDTSFVACNKGSEFMKKWKDEFAEIARYPNVEKYVESRDSRDLSHPSQVARSLILKTYPADSLIVSDKWSQTNKAKQEEQS